MSLYTYENEARNAGFSTIAGVDEVGRGPLAGPVVVAACILPDRFSLEGLNDSKQLTKEKREQIFDILSTNPLVRYSISVFDHTEIDRLNILQATLLGMQEAIMKLEPNPDFVLIDGNRGPKIDIPYKAIVDGDKKSASIAAASVIAKVTRDNLMLELDRKYPLWKFSQHNGYGTKLHLKLIQEHGVSPVHRQSFSPVRLFLKKSALPREYLLEQMELGMLDPNHIGATL
jgi:ribonuclease HII